MTNQIIKEKKHLNKPRPERVSLADQKRDLLTVKNRDDNFVYRWVNDVDDRLERLKLAGYEIVTDKGLEIGDETVERGENDGTPVTKLVGPGVTAYLMRTLKEYYDQDQAAKQAKITEGESAMKMEAKQDRYGDILITRK